MAENWEYKRYLYIYSYFLFSHFQSLIKVFFGGSRHISFLSTLNAFFILLFNIKIIYF